MLTALLVHSSMNALFEPVFLHSSSNTGSTAFGHTV